MRAVSLNGEFPTKKEKRIGSRVYDLDIGRLMILWVCDRIAIEGRAPN